jgi:hypothetical protein
MKHLLICTILATTVFLACQKPISWDLNPQAIASLATDSFGNCLDIPVYGTYAVDSALNDSNYIVVPVNVAATGSYYIYTNSVNGYSFQGSGNFTSRGTINVKLSGTGKPVFAQTDSFFIYFNSASCAFSVNVSQ